MRNINLLAELKNIRNTVTPDTPVSGGGGSNKKAAAKRLAVAVVVALAAVVYVGLGVNEDPPKPSVTKKSDPAAGLVADAREPAPDERGARETAVAPSAREPAPDELGARETAVVASAREPAPDELGAAEERPAVVAPIVSRPVAKAAGAVKLSSAAAANGGAKLWSVRFGLCVMERSCVSIASGLKKRGVRAYVLESRATVMTHRVSIGPWPTQTHAERLQGALERAGYQTSPLASGGKFYLFTAPFVSKTDADGAAAKLRSMGYRAERASKGEARPVYKVYEGAYRQRSVADSKRKVYAGMGIECIVEPRG